MNLECSLYGIIPNSKLDRLLQMLAGVTGSYASAFASHEIVLKPIDETPFGPSRNDDVILCLESNLTNGSEYVGFNERKWSLVQKGHPEPPKAGQKLANHRLIFKSKIEGNCLDFVTLLGYEFSFEYISKGWEFRLNDVRILIFQVFQLSKRHVTNTAVNPDETGHWIVQALSPLDNVESVQFWSKQLFKISSQLSGLVPLNVVDHTLLQQKMKYSA